MHMSLQISVSKLVVMSLISLCRMEGKPPLEHDKACSTENFVPQTQAEGLMMVASCSEEPRHFEKHSCAT